MTDQPGGPGHPATAYAPAEEAATRSLVTRRQALGAAVVAAGAAGVGGFLAFSGSGGPRSAVAPRGSASAVGVAGSCLQIIAHPDDDLFFMNPDVMRCIEAGMPVVTAVMTAATSDGRNVDVGAADRDSVPVDYPGYVEARHNGLRSAYALMATGDAGSPWRRTSVEIIPGVSVELDVLTAKPAVHLYFFDIDAARGSVSLTGSADEAEGVASQHSPFGTSALGVLWDGTEGYVSTLVSARGAVRAPQRLTHGQVVAALVALLARYKPTVVRCMDPDPAHDPGLPGIASSDHPDHTAVTQFALSALEQYRLAYSASPVVEHFHAYDNRFWPYNLSVAEHAEKRRVLLTYAGQDGRACPAHDCGDYQLGPDPDRSTHIFSTAYRYCQPPTWLVRRADGGLAAFGAMGGTVAWWVQSAPGGESWDGPRFLAGTDWINPAITVIAGSDGRTRVIAQRRAVLASGYPRLDIVYSVQDGPAAAFGPWQSLGGPDLGDSDDRLQRELGVPAAAVDGDGRLHVFVRAFDQTLSVTSQRPDGSWGGWETLEGADSVQDSPVALTTSSGRVEVYVAGKSSVYRFYQRSRGGSFHLDDSLSTTPPAIGGLTATEVSPDRIALVYREAKTAVLLRYVQLDPLGSWPGAPEHLGGHLGTGPAAVLAAGAHGAAGMITVHRNRSGNASIGVPATTDAALVWHDSGPAFTGSPALAEDARGRAVLAVLGLDGRLWLSRQPSADRTSSFGPWQAA